MHCTRNHCKHTRCTEGVFPELRKSYEENNYHPHGCNRPDHKDSRLMGGGSRRVQYGKGIEIRNRNKEPFDWGNE